jgi:nucleoside-diphosphate-sugar epimerase
MSKQPQNPTILVTGAYSQIGQFLLPELVKDYTVISVSRKNKLAVYHEAQLLNIDLITAEKKDIITVPELFAIIHLAPVFILPEVIKLFSDNLPQRIIAFSSTSIFGKKQSCDPHEQELISKLQQAENAIMEYCNPNHINWTIFRPTLIYGANQDKNISFIRSIINKYHFFPLVGDGKGLRQPVHAHDLALACVQALHNSKTYNKSYNLSGGETLTYSDMVKRIFNSLGKKVIILKIPLPVFRLAIKLLKVLPRYRFLSMEMANRMNSDLNFSHAQATNDFNYQPMPFTLAFKTQDFKSPDQSSQ